MVNYNAGKLQWKGWGVSKVILCINQSCLHCNNIKDFDIYYFFNKKYIVKRLK